MQKATQRCTETQRTKIALTTANQEILKAMIGELIKEPAPINQLQSELKIISVTCGSKTKIVAVVAYLHY